MIIAHKKAGFTLIEVIITIILVAMAGAIAFTYLSNILSRSHEPIILVRDLAEAKQAMESIVSAYDRYQSEEMFTWDDFKSFLTDQGHATTPVDGSTHPDFDGLTFEVIPVTITRGSQTVSTLFSE